MSIEHWYKRAAVVMCLAPLFSACGDNSGLEAVCGNNVVDTGEQCDGLALGGGTCMAAANHGGTLRCNADCTFDITDCTLASCGNGVIEEGEACDGADRAGKTCSSVGYAGGDIGCTADCAFDTTTCCSDTCPTEGQADCVGNSVRACTQMASGCLAWEVTDCGATNDICDDSAGEATCSCIDRCGAVGDQQCEGATIETCMDVGGCLDWMQTTNCATNSQVCAVAPSGPTCVNSATAEDCSDPYPLVAGENVVAWTALNADYLTSQPSCNTTTLEGPDLVLSYTAPGDGFIRFAMSKPASTRYVFVASSATCGTVAPELACVSEYTATTLDSEMPVQAGTAYYFYLRDTNSGSAPLENPLLVTIEETLCSTITPAVTSFFPENGAKMFDVTPILTAEVPYPIDPSTGTITLTGDQGTNLSFDLSTGPAEIAIINGGKTLTIDPGVVFPIGETVTVSWSGLRDATCDAAIAPPTWSFQFTGPTCTPGVDGMVGSTITRLPTGISTSPTEYYVATDTNPNGYVYFGGTSDLWRMPKAGGTAQNVYTAAGLSSSNLGYDMLVDGDQVFTLESNTSTSATSGLLWRITKDAGATWLPEDYMQLPQAANDDMRGITKYKGRYYMTTDEITDGTQIWSLPASATAVPQTAVLEATVPTGYCNGIALDDKYYYLACTDDDEILRVDRMTQAETVLTTAYPVNITKVALHADDFDDDGIADALYYSDYSEQVAYICKPGVTGPYYTDVLATFGSATTTSNYGLAFDPVNGVLWMYDDDSKELIKIQ